MVFLNTLCMLRGIPEHELRALYRGVIKGELASHFAGWPQPSFQLKSGFFDPQYNPNVSLLLLEIPDHQFPVFCEAIATYHLVLEFLLRKVTPHTQFGRVPYRRDGGSG